MLGAKVFLRRNMQKPRLLQPDCPVYLHAYTCSVEQQSSAAYVQMRFVNRSEHVVGSLFLRIRGLDADGNESYQLGALPIAACHALPHTAFAEEHVLLLPPKPMQSLQITVETVMFEDGMIWRRMPHHALMTAEEAGWVTCSCGMKNPADAQRCGFCGCPLQKLAETVEESAAKPEEMPVIEEAVIEELPAAQEAAAELIEEAVPPAEQEAIEAEPVALMSEQTESVPEHRTGSFEDIMKETAALLEVLRERSGGNVPRRSAPAAEAPKAVQEPETDGKGSRKLFTVFWTLALLAMLAAGVLGVLYFKGYLG